MRCSAVGVPLEGDLGLSAETHDMIVVVGFASGYQDLVAAINSQNTPLTVSKGSNVRMTSRHMFPFSYSYLYPFTMC